MLPRSSSSKTPRIKLPTLTIINYTIPTIAETEVTATKAHTVAESTLETSGPSTQKTNESREAAAVIKVTTKLHTDRVTHENTSEREPS